MIARPVSQNVKRVEAGFAFRSYLRLGKHMLRRKIYIALSIYSLSACSEAPEDLSVAPEAQTLSAYLQASTCLALQASPEEKQLLVAGLPFVDPQVSPSGSDAYLLDLKRVVALRIQAEERMYEVLSSRCPKSSALVAFQTDQLDSRTQEILKSHFADLVSTVLAPSVASPENLRRFYEIEHTAIGLTDSPY
jgi:hypothetical protein